MLLELHCHDFILLKVDTKPQAVRTSLQRVQTHDYSTRSQKNSRNELKMFLVSKIKAPGGLVLKTIQVYIYCDGKQSLRVSLSKGGDLISALGRKMQVFIQNNKSTLRTEGVVFAFSIVSIWKRFTRARCTCLRHEA